MKMDEFIRTKALPDMGPLAEEHEFLLSAAVMLGVYVVFVALFYAWYRSRRPRDNYTTKRRPLLALILIPVILFLGLLLFLYPWELIRLQYRSERVEAVFVRNFEHGPWKGDKDMTYVMSNHKRIGEYITIRFPHDGKPADAWLEHRYASFKLDTSKPGQKLALHYYPEEFQAGNRNIEGSYALMPAEQPIDLKGRIAQSSIGVVLFVLLAAWLTRRWIIGHRIPQPAS